MTCCCTYIYMCVLCNDSAFHIALKNRYSGSQTEETCQHAGVCWCVLICQGAGRPACGRVLALARVAPCRSVPCCFGSVLVRACPCHVILSACWRSLLCCAHLWRIIICLFLEFPAMSATPEILAQGAVRIRVPKVVPPYSPKGPLESRLVQFAIRSRGLGIVSFILSALYRT